jgi:hypothetical protein
MPAGMGRVTALIALSALLAAACGPTAQQSPSPSTSARATAAPGGKPRATPKPKPTPTPTPAPDAGQRWASLAGAPTLQNASITALTVTPSGLLASGHVPVAEQRRIEGAIWLTVDGQSWRRLTARRGFDGASVGEITRGPGGYLATGLNCGFESDCGGTRLWSSKDGLRWAPVNVNFAAASKVTLLASKQRWVAIGDSRDFEKGGPLVWVSANGQRWTRGTIEGTPAAIAGGLRLANRFVAYGTSYPAPDRPEPAAWTSVDGVKWTRVPRNLTPRGAGGEALAQQNALLIAFAQTATALEVWTSKDGVAWQLEQGASTAFEIEGQRLVRGVDFVHAGRNLVAFGVVLDAPSQIPPVGVWISSDGVVWDRAEDTTAFQDAAVHDVVQFRGGLVAVGAPGCPDAPCPGQAQFWVSPPR